MRRLIPWRVLYKGRSAVSGFLCHFQSVQRRSQFGRAGNGVGVYARREEQGREKQKLVR